MMTREDAEIKQALRECNAAGDKFNELLDKKRARLQAEREQPEVVYANGVFENDPPPLPRTPHHYPYPRWTSHAAPIRY